MPKEGAYRITDLAASDRPRERLVKNGAQSLNTAELLAILLRVGVQGENAVQVGQRLLQKFGGLMGLHRASFEEMQAQHGLGEAKAATLKAAIELGRRLSLQAPEERPAINSPADAAALVQYEMSALEQEHLRVILLDTRNQVLDIVELYRGSLNASPVRIAEVFKPAIRRNAASLILVHNHPSGNPTPSADDLVLTKAVREAGRLLDLELLDHLVIGQGRYISMKEQRLAFS
ncbi:MAG: JAB domain-containing protein [Chloroflexi bacterium]|nr:DNA repair protein RadC [Chloroflexota bacterium]MQC26662.1 JAB domain-containing protein [Chloroflexota bacterium]